ncbi:unnamed protein product [Blepharisma stoltei]|uniref:Uncharacterized protein n=1 Tax=Blepharisma stoltei TaxID=1481888 RepID=A0AAU9J1V1_9CILI|nr:unnamed protein product [Blepharisma stoltei]
MEKPNVLQSYLLPDHILPKGRRSRVSSQNQITINILRTDSIKDTESKNQTLLPKTQNISPTNEGSAISRNTEFKPSLIPIQRNTKKRKTLNDSPVFTTEDLSVHHENVKELFKNISPAMFQRKSKKFVKLKSLPPIDPPVKLATKSTWNFDINKPKPRKLTQIQSKPVLKRNRSFEISNINNKLNDKFPLNICLDKINWLSTNFFKPKISVKT